MEIKLNNKIFKSEDYKGKTDLLLENICNEFLNDDRFNFMERLEFTFDYLVKILQEINKNIKVPFEFNKLESDRNKLEVTIEQYKFIKYLFSGSKRKYEDYLQELEEYEVFSKDKALMTMVDYKLARFGNDIFAEMGIEIIDRIDKSFIVKHKDNKAQTLN